MLPDAPDLADINRSSPDQALAVLQSTFENSPWVAERALADRPFASVQALHDAMMRVVRGASETEKLLLLRAHPELAGREAQAGSMTIESTGEQGRLGLTALTAAELARMTSLNARYREKFGFPCIIALRDHGSRTSVMDEMERRLANGKDAEVENAIGQIGSITRGRLRALLRS